MQPPHQRPRVNLDELKAELVKKLGPQGSKQYFYYLQRFLSLKMSKVEFNKLCLKVLGRENIPLHNRIIRSILRNACCGNSPPPPEDASKHGTHVGGIQETPCDGYKQNGSHIVMARTTGSPRGRIGDALGPNGKISFHHQHTTENGAFNQHNSGKPVQQAEDERKNLVSHSAKIPEIRRPPDDAAVVYSKEKTELVVRNDWNEASCSSPLQAPLGVPLCPISIGGACRAPPLASSSRSMSTFDDGTLLDSHTLRDRMERIASAQGLEGVSIDSANILNLGLDSYIKGLLWSCIELVGARSKHEFPNNDSNKNHSTVKLINGVKPGHQYHTLNSSPNHNQMQEQKVLSAISLHEFRVAMELNPRLLGEDWPLLLEKICTQAFEE